MAYKEGLYWRPEQDELMCVVLTANRDSKEWLLAYKDILPRLKFMAVNILRRYFIVNDDNEADDLITDAITNLIMRGSYNPDKPKLYAYCGTLIKRYFYDILVSQKKLLKNEIINNSNDVSEMEYVSSFEPDFDEFDIDERKQILLNLLKICDDGITKCENSINKTIKQYKGQRLPEARINISKREILFLETVKEYLNNNFVESQISALSMADYVMYNANIYGYLVGNLMAKYFNVNSTPYRVDKKIKNKINYSFILDDYTPNNYTAIKQKNMLINKKYVNEFKYF